MDRRKFLACSAAAAVLPAAPVSAAPSVGVDLAAGPDVTVISRFLVRDDGLPEVFWPGRLYVDAPKTIEMWNKTMSEFVPDHWKKPD